MKLSLSILFLILINWQHKSVEGEYYDYFGSKLKINSNSTFLYTWSFDPIARICNPCQQQLTTV